MVIIPPKESDQKTTTVPLVPCYFSLNPEKKLPPKNGLAIG
jgi:hypothetical protein